MAQVTTTDFIQACVNNKITDGEQVFDALMSARVDDIINAKFEQISQSMFNPEGQQNDETE